MARTIFDSSSYPPVAKSSVVDASARQGRGWVTTVGAITLTVTAIVGVHRFPLMQAHDARTSTDVVAHTVLFTQKAWQASARARGSAGAVTGWTMVPRSAIVHLHEGPAVFVEDSDRHFVLTRVTLGPLSGSEQTIVSGVAPSDVVVTEGTESLRAELQRL